MPMMVAVAVVATLTQSVLVQHLTTRVIVAAATNHYPTHHGSTAVVSATVHGFTVSCWWAAGAFWAGAVICGVLIRGGTRLHHEAGQPELVDQVVSGPI
ncbi:hypothetical protein AB0D14_39795 [Streptomyces sp. NPDC048484]|uniref:hypothetical protein n=1 Tax=Streptomyces sp. NPDC048484 TaxID=3155146 RepID=UPI0034282A3D